MAVKDFKIKAGLQVPSLTTAGPVVTDSSGNISSSSVISISQGGTGQTTANNALNALLPVQSGSTINYVIQSDGSNTSWQKLYNQVIKNDGTTVNPRRNLNLVGFTLTDSSGTDTTTVTLPQNTYMRQSFTATSNQTNFTLSTAQIIGAEQVFLNGIMLVRGSDYTTPDTTTITLSSGAASGDSIEVVTLNSITSAGTLADYKKEINTATSSNITMAAGYRYFVDTTSARTLTLPASPSLGDEVTVFDASGSAATNNITVSSNSGKINGSVQDLIIDSNGAVAKLTYTGSSYGWSF